MAEDRSGPSASKVDAGSGAAGLSEEQSSPPGRVPLPTRVNGLPPLPPEWSAQLETGLDAVSISLTADQRRLIEDHIRLLVGWNSAINLTAIRDPVDMATAHVVDSLSAVNVLRGAGVDEFVDLGSGAGFPGLPLAIALPARRALLVDSVGKKARFLSVATQALGLNRTVTVTVERAESVAADQRHRGRWGAVVCRAVSGLGEVAELSLPLLRPGGLLVAWKREPIDGEMAAAERALHELGGTFAGHHSIHAPGLEHHVLVVVQKMRETPLRYPRDVALRRRRPL